MATGLLGSAEVGSEKDSKREPGSEGESLSSPMIRRIERLSEMARSFETHGDRYLSYVSELVSQYRGLLRYYPHAAVSLTVAEAVNSALQTIRQRALQLDSSGLFGKARAPRELELLPELNLIRRRLFDRLDEICNSEAEKQRYPPRARERLLLLVPSFEQAFAASGLGDLEQVEASLALQTIALESQRTEYSQGLGPDELVVTLLFGHNPSLIEVAEVQAAMALILSAAGVTETRVLEARQGSLLLRIWGKITNVFKRKDVQEKIQRGLDEAFDAATKTAEEKRKIEAERLQTQLDTELRKIELAIRSDPSVQEAAKMKAKAEALTALAVAQQEICKVEKMQLENLEKREELIRKTAAEAIKRQLQESAHFSVAIDFADVAKSLSSSHGYVAMLEGNEVKKIGRPPSPVPVPDVPKP